MHQHPRQPLSTAVSDQPGQTRTIHSRDRDTQPPRSGSVQRSTSASSEDFGNNKQESSADNPTAQMQRLSQVIQNFHTKAALIILHSRVELAEALSAKNNEKRVNRWFNIELDETEEYSEDIRKWRKCDLKAHRPPPLIIEIYLTADTPAQGQRLVIVDEDEKRWDVRSTLEAKENGRSNRRNTNSSEVLLERWTIELGQTTASLPADLTPILPLVYKKSIVLFRALFSYCNFLPAWKLSRKVGRSRSNMAMKLGYRILDGSRMNEVSRSDNLETPFYDSNAEVTSVYSFGETDSPAGPFSVKVRYRENCDFRIDDSEELLSSRFMGADDNLFRPSLPNDEQDQDRENVKVGSLPNDRRQHLMQRPELGHAYGSMSTFHQAGFGAATSPMSALRSARELGQPSPSPDQTRPQPSQPERGSLRGSFPARRTSFSFQPFKAPALSASPHGASPLSSSPRTSLTRVPVLGSLTEEIHLSPPKDPNLRKPTSQVSDNVAVPLSGSPKPTPTRYSSSFSHRRARLSSGGTRTDDDQISSGRGSAASSNIPPGSGLMAEASGGGSSGSVQEDGDNISDFLKMLDVKKDLLTSADAASQELATRRTANALTRFQRMKDSNAALSDSITSSLMLPRSSGSSRQLSGGPPMIGPTSVSSSSSPGKPVSPHTPHTPFAPSRLSAAYSHDEQEDNQRHTVEGELQEDNTSDDTAQDSSNTNVPAIDIPSSPRTYPAGYRRSSSAQRRPISSDDDASDIFGMRSASMGAPATNTDRQSNVSSLSPEGTRKQRPETSSRTSSQTQRQSETMPIGNDGVSDSGSARSSAHAYKSRLSRGSTLRGGVNVTPPQGSGSSFGGTIGGSIERAGESGGSASGSWARGGRFRSGSRPDNKFADDDEFLPFAMEKSDFTTLSKDHSGTASER